MLRRSFLLCLLWAACGDEPNRLYGSVSQIYKLDFDRVQILRIGDEVSVEYQRLANGQIAAKTAKVTVRVGDLANLAGHDLDLTELVNQLPRGTVQRIETTTSDFPLQTGRIRFDQEPVVGTHLTGEFHTTFSEPVGRTLNGQFQAKVEAR